MKKLMLLSLLSFYFVLGQNKNDVGIFSSEQDPWVKETLTHMTIEEKAGQLVFPVAPGRFLSEDSPDYQRLMRLVVDYNIGGFLFGVGSVYNQAILTNKLQSAAIYPLLIGCDFERGVAQRAVDATVFPYNMGIGAANDSLLTYEMGKIISIEGKALGVHQNYAPVADVNNNPMNPIINVRSYGEDPQLVARLSTAFILGTQDGGMIATSKHFPGHGNTSSDSHLEIAAIQGSRDELYKTELYPFITDINAGVMSCMIGHLYVPSIEKDGVRPSTLSPSVVTGLLKNDLGFKGLVVTDAMNMHAITSNYNAGEAAVLAFLAGNDLILFPDSSEACIDAIIQAVKDGRISQDRLDESVRKILISKKYAGLDQTKGYVDIEKISSVVGIKEHRDVALQLARKSITLLGRAEGILPLNNSERTIHISLLDEEYERLDFNFNNELRRRNPAIEFRSLTPSLPRENYQEVITAAGNYNVVLISIYLKVRAFDGSLGLNEKQSSLIQKLLASGKEVILLSHGNPYILSMFPETKTYLCNYGDAEVSETALAEALFGENDITGKLPVSVPGTPYKYGSGTTVAKKIAENKFDDKNFRQVDNIVESAIRDSAFPGAVLLVMKEGTILYEKAYGHFTYDKDSPSMELNTIFDLASVSKVIATTTATMLCYDRKLFKLDDRVADYIPEFAQNGKGHILIKNLLLHNAGLTAWKKFYEMYKTPDEVLKDIYASPLEYETGTKMVYSDLGMITMGKIIEKVTGKSLDEFCKDEIFKPLEMNNTGYNPSKDLKNRIAPTEYDNYWRNRQLQGEVHDETAAMLNGVAGHAGLFSTVEDISHISKMLLDHGQYKGKQFIKPETVVLFTRKYSALSSRALGWDTKSEAGSSAGKKFSTLAFGHTGYTGTSVWADPLGNVAVVFLTNRVYPTRNNNKLIKVRPLLHDAVIKAIEE